MIINLNASQIASGVLSNGSVVNVLVLEVDMSLYAQLLAPEPSCVGYKCCQTVV
jgi:hypothetical protein